MADIYVRSSDGSDSDNGSTWSLAKATISGADAIDAAGDTIYVSSDHSQEQGTAIALVFAGTLAAPTKLLSVDDSSGAALKGAEVRVTGNFVVSLYGHGYIYGVKFRSLIGSASTAKSLLCATQPKWFWMIVTLLTSQPGLRQ